MSSNVLQGSTKESIEPRSGLHLSLGGVKVIGNFAEHAPKQRPFGGILPLQGSFLSISWLVLAAIFFVRWIFCTARARFESSLGCLVAFLPVLTLSQALS